MRSGRIVWLLVGLAGLAGMAWGNESAQDARIDWSVEPTEATVGQRLQATLQLHLPVDTALEMQPIGPKLGPFTVYGGNWEGPIDDGEGRRSYRWLSELSAFEIGELEIPSIRVTAVGTDGTTFETETAPLIITLSSVLEEAAGEEPIEIADIKPPVSVPGDYRPLWIAFIIVGALALVAGILWWLQRRYAQEFAAVAVDDDAFKRMSPHEWVYGELKRLLEARLAEQGEVDRFYGELSRILKRYLEGRFRVDLMEHTTAEVAPSLDQAGSPRAVTEKSVAVLDDCDHVKFARQRPGPDAWRSAIEQVYAIVDTTKPATHDQSTSEPAHGAA